jgi:DeoR family ulaG and ulaABCDEF operon transcriptional repressor
MGVEGLDAQGATNTDISLIHMEQRMIDCADELIIVADSSKFEQRGHLRLCGFDRISRIITDAGIPDEQQALLTRHGVELVII